MVVRYQVLCNLREACVPAQPLLLLGAGGLAREILATVRLLSAVWKPIGALDDDPTKHGHNLEGVPVLGGFELANKLPDNVAILACIANARRPAGRLAVVRRLNLPNDRWATIIHPSACVPEGSDLGPGTVLLAGTVLTTPLRIGAHVISMPHVLITHDDMIAEGVTIAGAVSLAGGVQVGESAYLGQGSSVREKLSIGASAVIGMGSVVLQNVPAGEVWAGVPAKRIGFSNNS